MVTFKLSDDFIAKYEDLKPPFGFVDAAGTSLGEITFINKYSRLKEDGTKETWTEVCRRVIEGMYELQRQHIKRYNLPWSGAKAQASARKAFDGLWNLRWSPPGRGLWAMGTPMVMDGNAAPLLNCAAVSTADMTRENPGRPFAWLMEASMLGIGVSIDGKGEGRRIQCRTPSEENPGYYEVPDTREGWAESLRLLINSYLMPGKGRITFGYDLIRPAGAPIKTFGGVASGPEPLKRMHQDIEGVLRKIAIEGNARGENYLDTKGIADIANIIGVCVVSGNVRRSAELFMGDMLDEVFFGLKDYSSEHGRGREAWGWMSNNSVEASIDSDTTKIAQHIVEGENGEPGIIFTDTIREYGRLADPPNHKDHRAVLVNPCGEQPLESYECCTLVETFPTRCESLEEYLEMLKYAYLYAKTVTLLVTPWAETNAIMMRNRRIGTSMSGVADFYDMYGQAELVRWQDAGYQRTNELDEIYSEWLGIRRSIKVTTVKPSGTVSLLAGVSPGVHWQPGTKYYYRLIRFRHDDPIVKEAKNCGYRVEPDLFDPEGTEIVYFPMVRAAERGEHDVSLMEKIHLATISQRWWSDNGVSATFSYSENEAHLIGPSINVSKGNLKAMSFLPLSTGEYQQMPYTEATAFDIEQDTWSAFAMNLDVLYRNGREAEGEAFCTSDSCEIKAETSRS